MKTNLNDFDKALGNVESKFTHEADEEKRINDMVLPVLDLHACRG